MRDIFAQKDGFTPIPAYVEGEYRIVVNKAAMFGCDNPSVAQVPDEHQTAEFAGLEPNDIGGIEPCSDRHHLADALRQCSHQRGWRVIQTWSRGRAAW